MSKIVEIEGHVGHFGNGTGASSIVDEVKEARKIAQRVHAILTENKVPNNLYEDTVSKNRTNNINHLVKHHNKDNNGLVVSYHLNASGEKTNTPIGCEVLYYDQKSLAEKLSKAMSDSAGFKNRGAKQRKDLGVLVGTTEPAILLEVFFVNSQADVDLYNTNFEKLCQAIAKVLAEYLGKTIGKVEAPKPSEPATPHRVKSGSFETEGAAILAKEKVAKNSIAKSDYITVGKNKDGRFYFQTGAYSNIQAAESALDKMKKLNIVKTGSIIKV